MNITLFRQFADGVMRDFHPKLSEKLRGREIHLITLLAKEPNMPLFFYAEHIGLERGSFTYMVDVLEERGILVRKSNPFDKRHKSIVLTDKGLSLVREAEEQLQDFMKIFVSKLSEEDQSLLEQSYQLISRLMMDRPHPPDIRREEDE
ncbi:MAG: MarR family winged helix-turn-helix transcriptional regulator [Candidatus Izemoplasmatales bacterium]